MKQFILTLTLVLMSFIIKAQFFMPPIDQSGISMSTMVYVITVEGDSLTGKIGSNTMIGGQLRSFTLKQEDGNKIKYKAEMVKLVAVKPHKMTNFEAAISVPNVGRLGDLDYDAVMSREWVYFEQALLPKKKDKFALMQLMNSGFDSKIKVYQDPNAQQTGGFSAGGVQLTGGEDKSYLVVFDGNKAEVYKKSRYKKEALTMLFKDCDVFKENYKGEKFKWQNFAEHVLVYDQLCQ